MEWINRTCDNPRCDNVIEAHPLMSAVFCSRKCANSSLAYLVKKGMESND